MEEKKSNKPKSFEIKKNETEIVEQISEIDKQSQKKEIEAKKTKALNSETENKASRYYGWTAYILFFIPLIFNAKNEKIRFHVNQGFWLNIIEIATGLLVWLFSLGYNAEGWANWLKSISFILFICACMFGVILIMISFYLIFFCVAENGKEIKYLNKIKIFNKEK